MGIGFVDNTSFAEAKTEIDLALRNAILSETSNPIMEGVLKTDSKGYSKKYPLLGGMLPLREFKGPRQAQSFRRYLYELVNRKFEGTFEIPVDLVEDELLEDLIPELTKGILEQGGEWPVDLTMEALANGETWLCYDGQPFFNGSHPVDPGNSGSTTFSNVFSSKPLVTGSTINYDNFDSVLTSARKIKRRDGRIGSFGQKKKPKLYVPPELETAGRAICESPQLQGSTAYNPYQGKAEVVVVNALSAISAVDWYLWDGDRPWGMFQLRKDPRSTFTMKDAPSDTFEEDMIRGGVVARGAAGFTVPQTMMKGKG